MSGADCPCGCGGTCGGTGLVPPAVETAVADPATFRIGAIASRMKDAIGRTLVRGLPPLADWTTRDAADPGIALIEAQAQALHILAWNANRMFLDGTLTRGNDRSALVQLVRLLGHAPRPALSATTVLSFEMDPLPTAPEVVSLKQGLKIASVPIGAELPQTFETDAAFEARKAWNRLVPLRAELRQTIGIGTTGLTLAGTAPGVKVGDTILAYAGAAKWLWALVTGVTRPTDVLPLQASLTLAGQHLVTCEAAFAGDSFRDTVIILGERSQAFGATSPDLRLFDDAHRKELGQGGVITATEWADLVMTDTGTANGGTLDLGEQKVQAAGGRAAVFACLPLQAVLHKLGHGKAKVSVQHHPAPVMARITAVTEGARKDFGLSSRISRLTVAGVDLTSHGFNALVRETMIHLETGRETLLVGLRDDILPAAGTADRIQLVGEVPLPVGRPVILQGPDGDHDLAVAASLDEIATVKQVAVGNGVTTVTFTADLAHRYHSDGLQIHGNCVSASQGESLPMGPMQMGSDGLPAPEGLGVTDPTLAEPRYVLKGAPVAEVPAPGPKGYAPALSVFVGPREWTAVDSLLGRGPGDHVYLFRAEGASGRPEVQFAGPLPGGAQPVAARYRKGGGAAGNLGAGRISTLMTPVVGVRGVSNPLASGGGADAEGIDAIRLAAPKAIRTLDRVVSREDYEAFALAYRGVGKALASELRLGMRQVMCLTLATSEMAPLTAGSDVDAGLRAALAGASPPGRAVRIAGFMPLEAEVTLGLAVDAAFDRTAVEVAVSEALATAFAAAVRPFGRALTAAEIVAVAQGVAGVVALRVDTFGAVGGAAAVDGKLRCPGPVLQADGSFDGAGLLSLAAEAISFARMQP